MLVRRKVADLHGLQAPKPVAQPPPGQRQPQRPGKHLGIQRQYGGGEGHWVQFSISRPGKPAKSLSLFVTSVSPSDSACAAINRSYRPRLNGSVAYTRAAAWSNGATATAENSASAAARAIASALRRPSSISAKAMLEVTTDPSSSLASRRTAGPVSARM